MEDTTVEALVIVVLRIDEKKYMSVLGQCRTLLAVSVLPSQESL